MSSLQRTGQGRPETARNSLPLSFPPLFSGPANTSSTSLVQSTAEGRPIPLDNNTAAHRTTALRVLNNAYPSQLNRHRSTKSAGARSTTYSQPVLVRTYSGPSHSQSPYNATSHRYRPPSSSRTESRRLALPSFSRNGSSLSGRSSKSSPVVTRAAGSSLREEIGSDGSVNAMPRQKASKSSRLALHLPWGWGAASSGQGASASPNNIPSLPPIEAFSFKNMLNAEDTGHDGIGSDLDRIAEILERSKYSLSNQYEVHVAPHGSGASFVSDIASTNGPRSRRRKGHGRSNSLGGPTLQAIGSDDERRRRRGGGRRRSVAYGTLETIMSSSGSSGEAKSKKKPAAEIAAEVRGRAAGQKNSANSAGSGSGSASGLGSNATNFSSGTLEAGLAADGRTQDAEQSKLARKKSTSFATAVIGSHNTHKDLASPRGSTAALVGEPAQPRTSTSHIEIQTADAFADSASSSTGSSSPRNRERLEAHFSVKSEHEAELEEFPRISTGPSNGGLLSSLSSWVPWRAPAGSEHIMPIGQRGASSHAEGSLRQLLRSAEPPAPGKGKTVAVDPEQ
ncbi:hypothetical protein GQ53DRAFT_767435 [Thozetella sp. PMI_491]|nr:hypothetical protein GQ53DRAFT_767435 [Thozetella sp. PMI_491]